MVIECLEHSKWPKKPICVLTIFHFISASCFGPILTFPQQQHSHLGIVPGRTATNIVASKCRLVVINFVISSPTRFRSGETVSVPNESGLSCLTQYLQELIIHRHLVWDAFTVSRIRRVCDLWRRIVDDLYRRKKVPFPLAKVI